MNRNKKNNLHFFEFFKIAQNRFQQVENCFLTLRYLSKMVLKCQTMSLESFETTENYFLMIVNVKKTLVNDETSFETTLNSFETA